jgi:hypothetical protein
MRRAAISIAVAALATIAVVSTGAPEVARSIDIGLPSVEFHANDSFVPRALPKTERAPAVFHLGAQAVSPTGGMTPPLEELVLELDRNARIDPEGWPTCDGPRLDIRPFEPERFCPDAIVGQGGMRVLVAFPGQEPIPAESALTIINGGGNERVSKFFAFAYITQPITTQIVSTIRVHRIPDDHYGTKVTFEVPPIANHAGAITSLDFTLGRPLRGERSGLFTLRCPTAKTLTRGSAQFRDGTRLDFSTVSPCVPTDPS